jgi:TolB-like protein
MSEATKAVFLSYAREDADAARRIADALRGFGVEVWFDRSELRGGDAWDQKIRGQIKDCALFVPVISAHSEARGEGYFRLEWKLADERTHLMAKGVPFLLPVVVDETRDGDALVPDSFRAVQWTHLAGGAPTTDFVAQVKRLLESPRISAAAKKSAASVPPVSAAPAAPKRGFPLGVVGALGAVGAILAAFVAFRPGSKEIPAAPAPAQPFVETKAADVAPAVDPKSIAVLPFANLSDDKENAFFADGVHEDLLTSLTNIQELKVIARTSVMEYRTTIKKIPQIARELGVAYVLECSVRRAGGRVRVVCQLIDGRTGQHVWAPPPFDRDLSDIFAIQSELAESIATKLQAVISPGEKAVLERAPTANLTAHDLYLKALEVNNAEPDPRVKAEHRLPLLESAVQFDPKFVLGWWGIATVHLDAFNKFDHSDARRAKAKEALDMATRLDPDNVKIVAMLANYYIDARDLARATEQGDRLTRLFPNHAATAQVLARLAVRQGDPVEALANYRKARERDPRNPQVLESLSAMLGSIRHYDEASAIARELLDLVPDNFGRAYSRALIAFDAKGTTTEMEKFMATLSPEARRTATGVLAHWAVIRGDADEVIRLWQEAGANWRVYNGDESLSIAVAFVVKGQPERARPILEKERERLVAQLAVQPSDGFGWYSLAMTHALLGEKQAALDVRQKMLNATSEKSRQFDEGAFYAWVGEKDQALAELARGLSTGETPVNVHRMRHSLFDQPLQGDPRFEALLNDPKNNAPLF